MNMQIVFTILLACVTGTLADPYLQWCTLLGYKWNQDIGFVVEAVCNGATGDNSCQQMDIAHCFANYYGQLMPAAESMGNFNNTCTNCTMVLEKDAVGYGILDCQCVSGFTNQTLYSHASIQTSTVISWDRATGSEWCLFNNNQSIIWSTEIDCPPRGMEGMIQAEENPRERKIRRTLRETQKWDE